MVVFIGLWRFHRFFFGFWSKIGLFMYVYGKSPGFLHIFEWNIHDFNVYGISPTFLGSFRSNVSQFWCAFSALVLFAGKIAYRLHPGLGRFSVRNFQFSCLWDVIRAFDKFSNDFSPIFGANYGTDAFRREVCLRSASLPPRVVGVRNAAIPAFVQKRRCFEYVSRDNRAGLL